ncbi:histidine kinase [Paenibacillus yonginensis]|uniref:Circadian input-output histidine kinase CikA n=2 Tax=Paenibacillus yonginensis TaxID=1462996 RepID=A0A1B1N7I8_9BACL|nr:histidine kinase [Paenibacillus yonginensis]
MGNAFAINLSILVTIAYLANLVYKYVLIVAPGKIKYVVSLLLIFFSAYASMYFGFELGEDVIFDLRFVPLIIAALSYKKPYTIVFVGAGVGLCRLLFGINAASLAGCTNMIILGVVAALLKLWFIRHRTGYSIQAFVFIVIINVVNQLNIAVLGVIPFNFYMVHIVPGTLLMGTALSTGFVFMFRDSQLERRRNQELKETNTLMMRQTEELHKAKIVLEERAKQLMLASQYKSEFLANMSHELRTPLNSIINLAQLISENGTSKDGERDQQADEETALYGEIIYKSGQELLQLINDILDLSKVEAGRLEITQEEISICEIPDLVYLPFELLAQRKGIQFRVHRDESLPKTMYTDGQRVQQILRNLLSNAFKFTSQGEVSLTMRRSEQRDQVRGDWIVFEVQDTGIGIPEDKHHTIFEAFQQADGTISRKYGGTGLGLSISRDLARLLGGFIRMDSKQGLGSTFSLFLPLK